MDDFIDTVRTNRDNACDLVIDAKGFNRIKRIILLNPIIEVRVRDYCFVSRYILQNLNKLHLLFKGNFEQRLLAFQVHSIIVNY